MKFLTVGILFLLCIIGCKETSREVTPHSAAADSTLSTPRFDGERSFQYLARQTDFGPRPAGSASHEECLQFLFNELKTLADSVEIQSFNYTNSRIGSVALTNILAHFSGVGPRRLLLTAHWDSRPWADSDADPQNRSHPILGANDGASGVAVLLEIAQQLKLRKPSIAVSIVLFDGEDLGSSGKSESWCAGSKYFASHLPGGYVFTSAINLDMVGDSELLIKREQRSDKWASELADEVFSTAGELGISQFANTTGDDVLDDHVALNEAGIPAVDLIDFDYPNPEKNYWHTTLDTPDKCSAESLRAVGTVLLQLIYKKHQKL